MFYDGALMKRTAPWLVVAWLALIGSGPPQLLPLTVTTVTGRQASFGQAEHAVVIIHFWASWCAPCRVEMPMLDAVSRKYGKQSVEIVGISLDSGASRQKIAGAGMGVSFPLARLTDSNVRPRDVPAALPETLVYGRDGRLRYRFRAGGMMLDEAVLDRIIPALVAEP
jgi:thiol-disulfide isomerase/thioredoxin